MMSTREQEQPWSESPADESEDDRPWVIDEEVSPAPPARSPEPEVAPAAAPEAEAAAPDRPRPVEVLPEPPVDRLESGTDDREDEPPAPVPHLNPRPLGAAPTIPVADRRLDEPKDAPDADPANVRQRFRNPVLVATTAAISLVGVFILVNNRTGTVPTEKVEGPSESPAPPATVSTTGSAGSGNGPRAPEPGATPPRKTLRDNRDEIPPPREKAPPSSEEEPPTFDLKHTKPRPGQLESQMERPPPP